VYIERHAEETIKKLGKIFGAVLVSGARQCGKTTLLRTMFKDMAYQSLDDPFLLSQAREEGGTFFKDNPPPLLIDEIQYAPNLFHFIKIILDESRKKGQFFMTGSQQFAMMKNVSESLAGRLGVLNLAGLSMREKKGTGFKHEFLPNENYLKKRSQSAGSPVWDETWFNIHRGSMPELFRDPGIAWQLYYSSYVRTYLERDVRDLSQVGDETKFLNFMVVVAGHIGQLVNLASVARDVGISQPSAERWLSILISSDIVFLLRPYSKNIIKRTIKTPKLYFHDTGLAAWLTKWTNPDVLKNGAMSGAYFENFCISEIVKSYYNRGIQQLPLYFYRDRNNREIDLVIEANGFLHPLEIKKSADPDKKDIAAFSVLDDIPMSKRGPGGLICMYDHLASLGKTDKVIPVSYL